MDCTLRPLSTGRSILEAQRRYGGPLRALRAGVLVFLTLVLGTGAAQAQSCIGKVAGAVCRASAGSCDVAETCVATGSTGAPMFQPTDGTLHTGLSWSYNMGYAFTPNKTITITALGGFFNGTKTVSLYDRATGAVLASASVAAANGWSYAAVPPVTLTVGKSYSVGVNLAGSGGAYRTGMAGMPRAFADATVEGSCYRSGSAAEPCASSGLVSGTHYGMADFKYLVAKGLYQPTDGTLYTEVAGNYTSGYAFTPNKTLTVTSLGGFFNGTRTVYLYNRSTGAVLASASVPSANSWVYTRITPVTLSPGTSYTVAVYSPGTGNAYREGVTSMPSVLADASIEGTCYRAASTAEPCASSGLISGTSYGMADIQYAATGDGLSCPADSFLSAGSSCRGAAGTCDVAETCTGSSAACPANLFKASGLSCDDGQLCTFNDVCNGAGSCGGATITCGGGNACSTTVCNGTNTCEPAKIFCNEPPSECYNTLGACNTSNGSCSYTVKTGAPCGTRGTCQSSGACYTPPAPVSNGVPADCNTQTIPAPVAIGCESCGANSPCVVDSTATIPVEYQTCSGYTPRKGDIVLHEAQGLTQMLVSNFGSNWTHVGVFLGPQQGSNAQLVRHHALNLDGLSSSVIRASTLQSFLIGLSLNKNSAYCSSAKIDPATLLDSGQYLPGVPNSHTADMITESDGNGGLFWETAVRQRSLVIAANRAAGEQVADRMLARNDYYSLNSLVDSSKGMSRLNNGKPGANCASAIMSCITPTVAPTLLRTDKMRETANRAYEAIRRQVRWMRETEDAVTNCKRVFCPPLGLPCPVDCNGLAWETANGIADQVIACFLFGPTANGCECTRDNRKWHFANWAGAAPTAPTQDDIDWVNGRLTDVQFLQDTWTGSAAAGQPATTIYESYSYLPGDVIKSGNYPPGNEYPLIRRTNVTRKYGHCYAPPTVTGTVSPASANHGTTITFTATASGGIPASIQYAFFRRPVGSGTAGWIPAVTAPAWQSGNTHYWTPASSDVGGWEAYVWVRDGNTAANANTYGYAAGSSLGVVQVTAPPPPLTLTSCTASPSSAAHGTTFTFTATASGGTPATTRYAFFRRPVGSGTAGWIPAVTAPAWQSGNASYWTPASSDVGSWDTYVWVKDGNTPANANTYGYAAGCNSGVIQVTNPAVLQSYPPKGWVDGYNTQHIWGWACDPDYPAQSNRVDVYTTTGQYLGSAGADIGSVAAINSACRGGTAHYFDFYPSGGIPSGTHFNVWTLDLPYATSGNDNRLLGGNGSIGNGTEFVIP